MSVNPTYWKMRNGELIDINLMDINHLRKVLIMIVNNSNKHKEKQQIVTDCQDLEVSLHNNLLFNDDESRGNQW